MKKALVKRRSGRAAMSKPKFVYVTLQSAPRPEKLWGRR